MNRNIMQIISKKHMICDNGEVKIFANGTKIYVYLDDKEIFLGCIAENFIQRLLSNFRVFQRILRYEIRTGIFINKSTILISFHGAIYRIEIEERRIVKEHSYRKGMNNPLSFCSVGSVEGFDDGIMYGEYFANLNKESVNIWKRDICGNWRIVYTFAPKTITHVHKILVHHMRKSIFVLTGDTDEESAIWEASENFSKCEKIVGGSQMYRSCVAMPCKDGLVYVTDTPLENNGVYYLDLSEKKRTVTQMAKIAGPAIYGARDELGRLWFSTSVEPDSKIKPYIRYMISYRLGDGVKDRFSHVYYIEEDQTVNHIYKAKKDLLPMLLFGFGTFLFVESGTNQIVLRAQGLKNLDGKTIILKKEERNGFD